jgi:hypothetical protein
MTDPAGRAARPAGAADGAPAWPDGRRGGAAAGDTGSGVLGMSFGVLFFLGFLMVAAQVGVSLYSRSVVTSAALDAGRIVAAAAGPDGRLDPWELTAAEAEAAGRVRDLLGADAAFELAAVDVTAGTAEVSVRTPRPRLLLGGGTIGSELIERRVRVRLELLR